MVSLHWKFRVMILTLLDGMAPIWWISFFLSSHTSAWRHSSLLRSLSVVNIVSLWRRLNDCFHLFLSSLDATSYQHCSAFWSVILPIANSMAFERETPHNNVTRTLVGMRYCDMVWVMSKKSKDLRASHNDLLLLRRIFLPWKLILLAISAMISRGR